MEDVEELSELDSKSKEVPGQAVSNENCITLNEITPGDRYFINSVFSCCIFVTVDTFYHN